jgi:hypothetical protein
MRAKEFSEGILDGIKGYFQDRKDYPEFRDIERTKLLARMKAGVPAPANHMDIIKGIRQRGEAHYKGLRDKLLAAIIPEKRPTYERLLYGTKTSETGPGTQDINSIRKILRVAKKNKHLISQQQEVQEDLGPEQKKVGQLGPTEKVGKQGAVGKLVGC